MESYFSNDNWISFLNSIKPLQMSDNFVYRLLL